MKPTIYRRVRRHPASREAASFNKDKQQEQSFFGETSHDPFFKTSNGMTAEQTVQRKASGSVNETAQIHRMDDKKEEDNKVQLKSEEEKDKVQNKAQNPDEEDKVQKKEEKKEEDKVMKKEEKEEEKKEERKLQRKESATSSQATSGTYISSLQGKGNPLPAQTNAFFSSRMGYDFSDVKVHTGKEATDSAKELNAKAYTLGNDVVFNEGQYNTESGEGKKLMAHELTHVVQQSNVDRKNKNLVQQSTGLQMQRGFWGTVWGGIKSIGSAVAGGIKSVAGWGLDVFKSAGAWIWDLVTWLPSRVWSLLKHVGSGVLGTLNWIWTGITAGLGHVWDGVKGLFSWAYQGVEGLFNWIWKGIKGGAKWAYKLLHGDFSGFWDGLAEAFSWLGKGIKGFFVWGWKGLEGLVIWGWKGITGISKWIWDGFLGGLAWIGRFVAKILDLIGVGELWTLAMNLLKWSTRSLTGIEIAEARKVFAGSISYWQVRIDEKSLIAKIGAWFSGSAGMGVTTASTINFSKKISAAPGNADMRWLIHELTHVAQYTNVGLQYMGEALHAQATLGKKAYDYNEADLASKNLADFNREQQGDIIKNYYAMVLYGSTPYAADYLKMRNQAVSGKF